jgi:hypothetical protein
MTVFNNIGLTDELQAINTVLVSAGESPYPDTTVIVNQATPDFLTARDLIRKLCAEVQTEPWKFNTEDGVQWAPISTDFLWQDINSGEVINIFGDPAAHYIKWELTPCVENGDLRVILAPSEQFQVAGASWPVLRDIVNHRDGPLASEHPFLYLDVQWALDWGYLPEVARRYITTVAARRFCQQILGSAEKGSFSRDDELGALRLLKREQGKPRKHNLLNNPGTASMLGRDPGRLTFGRRIFNKE